MLKVANFFKPKVDSLRLSIPFERDKVIDKTLFEKLITVHESTGEIIKQKNGAPYIHETSCGLFWKIEVKKRNLVEGQARELIEEIYLIVNAKHLKSRYFEGITMGNIHFILHEINALNIVKLTLGDLLNSQIGDVDLCFDFPTEPWIFEEIIDRYGELVQVRKQDVVDPPFRGKMNLGRQFNKRDKQTPAKPYCKFYFKTYELDSKSLPFSDRYLKGIDYSNIGRFELNLKNRKALKQYHLDNVKTLKHLLSLEEKHMKMVFQIVYRNWFIPKSTPRRELGNVWHQRIFAALFDLSDSNPELQNFLKEGHLVARENTNNRDVKAKIMKNHLKHLTPIEDETKNEVKTVQAQLDMFFGVHENRTYDVREKVPKSKTNRSQDQINFVVPKESKENPF